MTAHSRIAENPWARVLTMLKVRLDEYIFANWFEATRLKRYGDGRLEIEVPTPYFATWLRDHYLHEINECVHEILPEPAEVVFVPMEEAGAQPPLPRNGNHAAEKPRNGSHAPTPRAGTVASPDARDSHASKARRPVVGELNGNYTFDRFVVGASNRFANAAAGAVAEKPASAYNPLFLYGGTGLGKTHLMHAIGHEVLRRTPRARIVLVSSEVFTNELIEGIRQKSTESFRARYRKADILLIDDIHFIAGKEATQEEFFHTFNALFDMRKQIVISSDRQPKEIKGLEDRLISRFEWGLVTDIQAPDLETRMAILQTKAAEKRATVPPECMRYIATYITNNIRELEGALITLLAFSKLNGRAITPELAEEVLGDLIGKERIMPINIDSVLRAVADHFDVRLSELRGQSRQKHVTRPRHIAMFLCKRLIPSLSLSEIGEAFGGKDHTTVINACKRITKVLETEADLRQIVNHLEKVIRS